MPTQKPRGRDVEQAKPVYGTAELMRAGTRSAAARTPSDNRRPPIYRSAGLGPARSPRRAAYLTPGESGSFRPAPLGAVALLVLLAAPAPAGIVAADVVPVGLDDLLGRRRAPAGHARGRDRAAARSRARRRDCLSPRERLVLVLEVAVGTVRRPRLGERLLGLGGLELRVEQREHDLPADLRAELLEHDVALVAILHERVLLRHRAQVDALAEVVHRVEVLAPPLVDDLEDHEALELAHQLGAELLLLRLVLVPRILLELLGERLARDVPEVLFELGDGDLRLVQGGHLLDESLEVPFLGVLLLGELRDGALDHLVDPLADLLGHVLAGQHLPALLVDLLALDVHHVVVLEDVLPGDEVLLLDLLLGALDLVGEDLRLHRLVRRDLEALHDPLDPVAGEEADQVVLAGEVEAGLARVALAARAAAQLVVDPAGLVALRGEHVEPARLDDAVGELDVDAAAGHVRRDRDRPELAGVLDDLGLARVLLGVEDGVRDSLPRQQLAQVLRGLDRDRADEDGLPLLVALLDVADDRLELPLLRLEDKVVLVVALDGDVGRDLDHVQVVDLDELLLLGLGRTGHAGELLVEAEVVLEGDRRERDVLLLDLHALLDLAVLDHVVDVALVERLGLEPLDQVVDELRVARVVEVLDPERALDLRDRPLARRDRLVLLVVLVVDVRVLALLERVVWRAAQRPCDSREVVVELRGGLGLAGDDQRRTCLVDQDRVDLVHDRVAVTALDGAVERDGHVVAQVVEAELGIRPVRDVGRVGLFPLRERHHVLDVGDRHTEALVDAAVPLGVALGEVVVDGDEVDALALERVQVEREAGDERLAFARLHLGDVALVEDDSAHQLDVEHPLARFAQARLSDGRERLEEQVLECLAVLQSLPELGRLGAQLLVGERLEVRLERGDVGRLLLQALEPPAFADAQDLLEGAELLGHRT